MNENSGGLGYDVLERTIEDVQRLARLEEHREQLATKEDIVYLKGEIKRSNEELRGYVKETVSELEISALKGFIKTLCYALIIAVPVFTALLVEAINRLAY